MLLGLAGGIGAGKDTAFARIRSIYSDHEVIQISFAAKLKNSAAVLFDLDASFWELSKRDSGIKVTISDEEGTFYSSMTVREMLQRYGTEAHRDIFGDNFWVDAALPPDYDHTGKIVVVTDARFGNELQRVIDLGGINVLLEAEPESFVANEATHASETSIDPALITEVLDNRARDDQFLNLDRQLQNIVNREMQRV